MSAPSMTRNGQRLTTADAERTIYATTPINRAMSEPPPIERNGYVMGSAATMRSLVLYKAGLAGDGIADTFETVAKNLDAAGALFEYAGGNLMAIRYGNGVVKSFDYDANGLAAVTLSGAVPAGVAMVKSLSYTGGELTAISYS